MNLRRRKPHDSLYMLLDTMCNAFGGIILLAVLVVLLTSKEKSQSASRPDSTEMLQRRVALAQTNLQHSLELYDSLKAKAGADRWKTQVTLLATRQQLDEELKVLREIAAQNAQQIDANASLDPTERLKELNAQVADGEIRKLEAQNKIEASQQEKKSVANQLGALEKQMAEVARQSQRELRLPREHDTDRQIVYAILMYGRVYLCRNADMTRNESDIQWTDKGPVEFAEPRKGKGLDATANAAQLRTYFAAQAHNSKYIVFVTFPDSFPTFIQVKELALESGMPYGWVPFRRGLDGDLSFSQAGSNVPRPQ